MGGEAKWFGEVRDQRYLYTQTGRLSMTADVSDTMSCSRGLCALLKDSLAPAVFPSGSFGSILVVGERSRTGDAFFTKRILAFLPGKRGTGQPLSFAVVQRLGLISDAAENRSARIEQNVLWAEERAGFAFRLA